LTRTWRLCGFLVRTILSSRYIYEALATELKLNTYVGQSFKIDRRYKLRKQAGNI
jgi:hypothetical protein